MKQIDEQFKAMVQDVITELYHDAGCWERYAPPDPGRIRAKALRKIAEELKKAWEEAPVLKDKPIVIIVYDDDDPEMETAVDIVFDRDRAINLWEDYTKQGKHVVMTCHNVRLDLSKGVPPTVVRQDKLIEVE